MGGSTFWFTGGRRAGDGNIFALNEIKTEYEESKVLLECAMIEISPLKVLM